MSTRALPCLAALVLTSAGCELVARVDGDYREVEPGSCGGTGTRCVGAPPAGFQGPVIVRETADPWDCPAEFPVPLANGDLLFAGLAAKAASCDCSCQIPAGACSTILLTAHDVCGQPGAPLATLTADQCQVVSVPGAKKLGIGYGSPVGMCTPAAKKDVPALSWGSGLRGCAIDGTPPSCATGTCIPAHPSDAWVCVYQHGEANCDTSEFSQKRVYYTGANDQRDCSECTCGKLDGNCNGTVSIATACGGTLIGTPALGACAAPALASLAVTYSTNPTDLACVPTGGVPIGAAEPAGQITLCCLPNG